MTELMTEHQKKEYVEQSELKKELSGFEVWIESLKNKTKNELIDYIENRSKNDEIKIKNIYLKLDNQKTYYLNLVSSISKLKTKSLDDKERDKLTNLKELIHNQKNKISELYDKITELRHQYLNINNRYVFMKTRDRSIRGIVINETTHHITIRVDPSDPYEYIVSKFQIIGSKVYRKGCKEELEFNLTNNGEKEQ